MSELTQIQSKIDKQQSESPAVQRADVLNEDTMVDALQDEQPADPIVDSSIKESIEGSDKSKSTIGYLTESLFQESENGDSLIIQTTNILTNLFGNEIATLFMNGDDGVIATVQNILVEWLEQGATQSIKSQLGVLDGYLQQITPEDNCNASIYTIDEIGSSVRSTLIAFDAMYAEGLGEESQTILAFQNLTRQEALDVEEDLSNAESDVMSSSDRERLMAGDITMIEVEEVMVDFWEAAQKEKYEIEEEDKI